jgi:hypothetical protein
MARSRSRNHALWLGPLTAFVGMVSYFEVFARYPTLRDFPWVNLPLVVVGLAWSALGVWRSFSRGARVWVKLAGSLGLAVSLLCSGFLMVYVFGISYSLPDPTAATLSMDLAPDFALEDSEGRLHRLSDYRGRRVVLVFYRGHW